VKRNAQKKIHVSMYIPIPVLVTVDGLSTLSINNCRRTLSEIRYISKPIPIPVDRLAHSKTQMAAVNIPKHAFIQ